MGSRSHRKTFTRFGVFFKTETNQNITVIDSH